MARTAAALILAWAAAGCASAPDEPGRDSARSYVEAGKKAATAGDYRGAIDLFSKGIRANPESAEAYYGRGGANVKLRLSRATEGDIRIHEERALADFTVAIRLDPTYADAYFNRAMVLSSRAKFKQAAEDLLNAARYRPQDPEAHLWLGRLYEEKFEDRMPSAMDHYEKYVDLGGTDYDVREKVKVWKELKKAMATPSKTPTADDEKRAEELHETFKRTFAAGQKAEAVKAVEELVSKYGHTQFVQRRAREMNALLNALRKDAVPKEAPGNP